MHLANANAVALMANSVGKAASARGGNPSHLVIGVCTRQRNALLRRLLQSLADQSCPQGYTAELIVVDNNTVPIAHEVVQRVDCPFPVRVVHEAQAGLASARNRALDTAEAQGADWFVGLDDDEWVAQDWLVQTIWGIQNLEAQIVVAPSIYVYDDSLSSFLEPRQLKYRAVGKRPAVMSSANFVLAREVFDASKGAGLRFDMRFNHSGGEDFEYFMRAEKAYGFRIAAANRALAFENWGGERSTLKYALIRTARTRLTVLRVQRQHRLDGYYGSIAGNLFNVLKRTNRQFFAAVSGLVLGLSAYMVDQRLGRIKLGRGLILMARVFAVFMFLCGLKSKAYGPKAS